MTGELKLRDAQGPEWCNADKERDLGIRAAGARVQGRSEDGRGGQQWVLCIAKQIGCELPNMSFKVQRAVIGHDLDQFDRTTRILPAVDIAAKRGN